MPADAAQGDDPTISLQCRREPVVTGSPRRCLAEFLCLLEGDRPLNAQKSARDLCACVERFHERSITRVEHPKLKPIRSQGHHRSHPLTTERSGSGCPWMLHGLPMSLFCPLLRCIPDQIIDRVFDVVIGFNVFRMTFHNLPLDQFNGSSRIWMRAQIVAK